MINRIKTVVDSKTMCVQVDEMHGYKYRQHDMSVWFNGACFGGKTLIYIVITNSKKRFNGNNKIEIPSVVSTRDRGNAVLSGDTQAKSEVDKHWVSCIPM